jgi:phosphoglycolate phosphatase
VGANDAPHDKPAVEAVDLALEGSGLTRGEAVWFVGDTDIDMLCAQRAGCLPVLLRAEPPAPEEFGEAAPRCHVTTCEALAELATAY